MSGASEPTETNGGEQDQAGINRSEHARLRFGQGRPIAEVVNDVQRAGPHDVFVQPDDGRFVVRGPRGREHIIEAAGQHVTSLRRPDAAHHARVQGQTIRPATEGEFQKLKAFVS